LKSAVTKNNVFQTQEDLLSLSDMFKEKKMDGKLKIVTALYNVKTGKVEWIKQEEGL